MDDVAFRFSKFESCNRPRIQSVSRSQYSFLSTPLLILEIVLLAMVMFYYVMLICELVVRIGEDYMFSSNIFISNFYGNLFS